GNVIVLIAVIIMWFIMDKTNIGYEIKAVGYNPYAFKYAGMNVSKNIILAMVISGAFAGLAGSMEGLGTFERMWIQGGFSNLGFDGIAVGLLGANTAIGIVLATILFGGLKVGALNMPTEAGIQSELVDVIIALIIFFVASSYIIRRALLKMRKGEK